MRELSPVQTVGIEGYYTKEDMALQMIFYSDITLWRTLRLMKVAEECKEAGRAVLLLTENPHVEHLANSSFLVYRPCLHGLNPRADALAIIASIRDGKSVVVNTTETELHPKNILIRYLMNGLAGMNIENVALVVENTEAFFPRLRSYGDNEGMHTLGNLLRRAKIASAPFVFAAVSPQEIAREIAKSCGVPILGRVTNDECMRDVSRAIDPRIRKHADTIYGAKSLSPRDFYLWNCYSAHRETAPQMVLDIDVNIRALTMGSTLPRWLSDRGLTCGFDPDKPKRGPKLDSDDQTTFVEEIEQSRIDNDEDADTREAAVAGQPAVAAKQTGNVVKMRGRKSVKKSKSGRSSIDCKQVQDLLEAAGIVNAKRYIDLGLAIISSRPGRLKGPVDKRLTTRSLAQRIIADDLLRDAALTGFRVSHRLRAASASLSGRAYAAAYYQAMTESPEMASAFHREMMVEGLRSGRRTPRALDLEEGLRRLGEITNAGERAEAQYQLIRNAWSSYQAINADKVRQAA